jgi:predicted deacylase
MHPLTHEKAKFTAIAALTLCVVVGCYAEKSKPEPPAKIEPPAELLKFSHLRPPILIKLDRSADWDKPQTVPAPEITVELMVEAPIIQPVEYASLEQQAMPVELDQPAAILANPSVEVVELVTEVEQFLDATIAPGSLVQTTWTAGEALHGAQIPIPVLVARGDNEGPTLCVTAAVHGDELNGIESVRQLMYSIQPEKLSGTVIGVPIVNLQGFQRHSRYLSDRRDLNRFFPGNPRGSSASRMAHGFFNDIISKCDGLVDLHTGSFHRTNLPQLRADLQNADVLALTKGFGATVILHSSGGQGTLRRAAVDAGIPAVTLEAGEPLRLQEDAVDHTVKALFTLLDTMQMYNKRSIWGNPEPTYYSSSWVRADQGGILLSSVKLGRKVSTGDLLGTVTDPISNDQVTINAPYAGRVIGMALNQFVMPGFATFHLATEGALDESDDEEHYHSDGLDVAAAESLSGDESE